MGPSFRWRSVSVPWRLPKESSCRQPFETSPSGSKSARSARSCGRTESAALRRAQAEHERLETELHQSQRLESLGQLAGGIAHDFNNLIAVIVNYAAFVHDEATRHLGHADGDSGSWQMVRSDVEQIELAGERASQLTHRLLAFARREVVRPEVLDLNRVVQEVEQLLRHTIGEHVELGVDVRHHVRAVLADRGQIEQVMLNLAVNARNAMPTGGTLTLDTGDIEVDDQYIELHPHLTAGPYVRLRVSDTGCGMTSEVIEHAFEPFFTTKPQGEGSGLGLATVHGIISQANGYVHIYSEPDLGTTVTVLLPATEEVEPVVVTKALTPDRVARWRPSSWSKTRTLCTRK